MTVRLLAGIIPVVGVVCCLVGCGPAAAPPPARATVAHHHEHDHHGEADHDHDHDHGDGHDHGHHVSHDSLAEAVAELEKVCAAAKVELGKKNLDDADGHVHMVGHLLEDMHRLVAAGKLPAEAEAAAKKALDEVFTCFDALDTALHSSDEKVRQAVDYLEHEPTIAAAIETLKKIDTKTAAAPDADQ